MTDYLYRVVVTKMPEGSHWEQELDDGTLIGGPVDGWAPAGWKPEGNYVEILGTTEFVWPVTNKLYKSRSTANKRAALMRRYGAECEVQRSSRITWPDEEPAPEEASANEFSFYSEPYRIVPGVFTGVGSGPDDADRIYLATDGDKLLTSAEALKVAIDLLNGVHTAGGAV